MLPYTPNWHHWATAVPATKVLKCMMIMMMNIQLAGCVRSACPAGGVCVRERVCVCIHACRIGICPDSAHHQSIETDRQLDDGQ